jgi:hypothetical protein
MTIKYIVVSILLGCILAACQKTKKGCLDPAATNYNVSADEACVQPYTSACSCEYPKLFLGITHAIGDTLLTSTQTIQKKPYVLKTVAYFVSNIALVNAKGVATYVNDTIRLNIKKNATDSFNLTLRNDVQLIGKDQTNVRVGTFRGLETYKFLRVTIGLNDTLAHVNYRRLGVSNPFGIDSLYRKKTWDRITTRFLVLDKKTLKYTRYDLDTPITFNIPFPKDYQPKDGYDLSDINLIADYALWLNGIDFAKDDSATIRKKMLDNASKAFKIRII